MMGVGCDERGPLPGVGGRGVSGGVSSGAGIEVPSVREKLMGVKVRGWYLSPAMAIVVVCRRWVGAAVNGRSVASLERAMAEIEVPQW